MGFLGLSVFVSNAIALPAFSRQMGVSCSACHSQSGYPALNRFGRSFKASGYTMVGTQATIKDSEKDKFMSLTGMLNMSLMANFGITKSSSSSAVLNIPNEASVFVGGRIANGVGTFTEMGYDAQTSTFGLANMRLPFIYNVSDYTIGVVPYLTDGDGPSSVTNLLNAGSVVTSLGDMFASQNYVQNGDLPAEGISLYVYNDLWNAAYSVWVPTNGSVSQVKPANFASLALTPQVGSWDIDFGAEMWWGTSQILGSAKNASVLKQSTNSYALKIQARGLVGTVPLSIFADYANAKHNKNSLYAVTFKDKNSATLSSEVAVIPRVFMLSAGYKIANNGKVANSSDDATLIGARYFYRENVQFRFGYMYLLDKDSNKHNLMLALDLAL